jgi:hypothetical protein
MSEMFDKAKQMAGDAVDKVKEAVGGADSAGVDAAIDKAADAAQGVAPDAADATIQDVAQKAKDAL